MTATYTCFSFVMIFQIIHSAMPCCDAPSDVCVRTREREGGGTFAMKSSCSPSSLLRIFPHFSFLSFLRHHHHPPNPISQATPQTEMGPDATGGPGSIGKKMSMKKQRAKTVEEIFVSISDVKVPRLPFAPCVCLPVCVCSFVYPQS